MCAVAVYPSQWDYLVSSLQRRQNCSLTRRMSQASSPLSSASLEDYLRRNRQDWWSGENISPSSCPAGIKAVLQKSPHRITARTDSSRCIPPQWTAALWCRPAFPLKRRSSVRMDLREKVSLFQLRKSQISQCHTALAKVRHPPLTFSPL